MSVFSSQYVVFTTASLTLAAIVFFAALVYGVSRSIEKRWTWYTTTAFAWIVIPGVLSFHWNILLLLEGEYQDVRVFSLLVLSGYGAAVLATTIFFVIAEVEKRLKRSNEQTDN